MDSLERLEVLQNNSGASPEFYDGRFEHVYERMAERFNLQITREEWQRLNLSLFTDAPNVRWVDIGDTTASSLYMVEYRGEGMLMAWSETAYAVMTVMPRNDLRILHIRENKYIARARTSGDTAFRDQRQALAAEFDNMELDGAGRLVKPRESVIPEAEQPPQYHPFKEALQGFKPAEPTKPAVPASRAILTVVSKEPSDGLDPEVVAAFAALNRQLDEHEVAVEADEEEVEAEIADLEERIRQLRSGSALSVMKREFIGSARKMAEDAFGKFRDGVFTSEASLSFSRLLGAQSATIAPPSVTEQPTRRMARGLEGVSPEGPDAVKVINGRETIYRLDGIEDNLYGWSIRAGTSSANLNYRMKRGMSFRAALFKEKNKQIT